MINWSRDEDTAYFDFTGTWDVQTEWPPPAYVQKASFDDVRQLTRLLMNHFFSPDELVAWIEESRPGHELIEEIFGTRTPAVESKAAGPDREQVKHEQKRIHRRFRQRRQLGND